MKAYFDPYNADRPLLMKCGCGKHHSAAEHQKKLSAAQATLGERSRASLHHLGGGYELRNHIVDYLVSRVAAH